MAASASIICNYRWDGKGKVMVSSEKIRDIRSHELEVVNKVLMGQYLVNMFLSISTQI